MGPNKEKHAEPVRGPTEVRQKFILHRIALSASGFAATPGGTFHLRMAFGVASEPQKIFPSLSIVHGLECSLWLRGK